MSINSLFPMDKWNFQSHSLLTELPPEDAEIITGHMSDQYFSKGEIIFREGSFPSGIFFIRNGKIKKYKVDSEGSEQIIYVANTGELFGYHALLADERYPDSAAALEESLIAFIPKEDFLRVLSSSKILSQRLLKLLSHEFTVFANSVSLLAQRNVRERLATQLVVMREKYKENYQTGMTVEINLSRDDLASMVGTARENIVRILKEFKEDGAIQTKGRKIVVIDVHKLLKIANQT
ncbi:Crp/Fnr family transcriptional regulator [Flavitalea sp. BT771]|uniref:Crp/Fnr family transcriptional regulator n=1 Tax=Flavitalea sp. BT771 TaxID=3063329 RepID=UPI0026E384AA|nr:Crp/Fnr family transcriptional regulator [Flavitalea sp. BT771]MDO6430239.1 Crp/Fnr family transcriptional regulator [Flavitalea sp. BT771]MDV6219621.1 Crp/Fnr family transcriptional regulator [Flavitalea sp. BT771]